MSTEWLKVKNRAKSTLTVAISDSDISITTEGDKFPSSYPFHLTIDDEIVSCTDKSGDVLTIVRAQQDTTAVSHAIGAKVELRITAKSIADLGSAVNTLEDISHSHSNKSLLDTYSQTENNLSDAVTKKHSNTLDHPNSNDPTADQKAALTGTSGIPSETNKYITNNDSRNSDARTPLTHNQDASTINSGTLDGNRLSAMSSTKKGGVPATGTPSGTYLRDDGSWATPAGGGESEVIVLATQDTANSTTTFADITGLTFEMLANKIYIIEVWIIFQSNTATTGIKFALNGPASPVAVVMNAHIPVGLTLYASSNMLSSRAYNTGTPSVAVDTINSNLLCKIDGLVSNGNNLGTLAIRFAAETTGTVTVKAGSTLRYRQVN